MIDTPDDLLLLEAEHLARDLLLDAEDTRGAVAGLIHGWASVIRAAEGYFAPQKVTPCSQVQEIGRGMRRDALDWVGKGPPDPRLIRIQELFEDSASADEATRSDPRRQNTILQTCYVITHAVAGAVSRYGATLCKHESTRAQGQLVAALGSRVQSAEQILDAELSVGPIAWSSGARTQPLATAIAAWDKSLHDALVDKTPDPRVLLVSANVSIGLLRRTAELVSVAAANHDLDSYIVHSRLWPALSPAIEGWERSRATWRALAPATTGMPYPVAAAAHRLHRALQLLEAGSGSETGLALRLAIMATVEAAQMQIAALRRSDLRGMASGVSTLTQAVFEQVPGAGSLALWRQLERLDGRAPISIPAPVRTEMLRQAVGTLELATLAASASHGLIKVGARNAPSTAERMTRERKPPYPVARRRDGIDRRL
jgi:methylphosphotriester-DNA--protein-cysteine methyltransferase